MDSHVHVFITITRNSYAKHLANSTVRCTN